MSGGGCLASSPGAVSASALARRQGDVHVHPQPARSCHSMTRWARHRIDRGTLTCNAFAVLTSGRSVRSSAIAISGRPRAAAFRPPRISRAALAGRHITAFGMQRAMCFRQHSARQRLAIARRIADAGTAVLLVKQNVHKALAVADRGHVFERGPVVAGGSAAELARSDAIHHAYPGAAAAASPSQT